MPTATKIPKKARKRPAPEPVAPAPRIGVIVTDGNWVGALQEAAVREGVAMPKYELVEESGPDHRRVFTVSVNFAERAASGFGATKKHAKTDAVLSWVTKFGAVAEK